MVEKKEGAEQVCKCGTHIICNTKHYEATDNYPAKTVLQWQNPDGTAHFFTKDGKTFTCNMPILKTEEKESLPTTKPSLDLLDESTKNMIKNEAILLYHVRKHVESAIKQYEIDPHGGMIWEMAHAIWLKYFGDKK